MDCQRLSARSLLTSCDRAGCRSARVRRSWLIRRRCQWNLSDARASRRAPGAARRRSLSSGVRAPTGGLCGIAIA